MLWVIPKGIHVNYRSKHADVYRILFRIFRITCTLMNLLLFGKVYTCGIVNVYYCCGMQYTPEFVPTSLQADNIKTINHTYIFLNVCG